MGQYLRDLQLKERKIKYEHNAKKIIIIILFCYKTVLSALLSPIFLMLKSVEPYFYLDGLHQVRLTVILSFLQGREQTMVEHQRPVGWYRDAWRENRTNE